MRRPILLACVLCAVSVTTSDAQDRATKVLNDRARFADSEKWIYNDLERGVTQAKESNKPLLVVLRCIP